jgi:hypothetical protein
MHLFKNRILRWLFLALVVIPLATWFIVKPVRVIAAELLGVVCYDDGTCVDATERFVEAQIIRSEAVRYVGQNLSPLEGHPKVVFCSSDKCATSFGLGKRSAVTFGPLGTVIGPNAWKPFYVRHELIHQLQAQKLGILWCLLAPEWLVEGMAYSLSQDPRATLNEPWQSDRAKFNGWLKSTGSANMWQQAAAE